MRIAVFDGQGAGIGQEIIKQIRQFLPGHHTIIALGANTYATSKMVRAGASIGISGEKGFCSFCRRESIDCIIAPISILQPGSLQGEMTARMVHAFVDLSCKKFLLPIHLESIGLPGLCQMPIKNGIKEIIQMIRAIDTGE